MCSIGIYNAKNHFFKNVSKLNYSIYFQVEESNNAVAIPLTFCPPSESWQRHTCERLKLTFRNYVDYSGHETVFLNCDQPGSVEPMVPDGNCLFRAICFAITGSQYDFQEVRAKICQFMLDHAEAYFNRNVFDANKGIHNVVQYLKISKMLDDKVWGTDQEIIAASSWLKIPIFVYTKYGSTWLWSRMPCMRDRVNDDFQAAIYLYHSIFESSSRRVKNVVSSSSQECNHYDLVLSIV